MKKVTYTNEMPYEYRPEHRRAPYYIPAINKYRNHGELCEHIAKYYRGIFTEVNPNTSFDKGSDIESEHASVKSSRFGLAENYGGASNRSDAIKYYFKHVASSLFIYVEFDEKTQTVTEYQMNRKEFGRFIYNFISAPFFHKNGKIELRGLKTSKKMIKWFEAQC